jgi:hypothetical protein
MAAFCVRSFTPSVEMEKRRAANAMIQIPDRLQRKKAGCKSALASHAFLFASTHHGWKGQEETTTGYRRAMAIPAGALSSSSARGRAL